MIIRTITPIRVADAELHRRQARYDRLSPEGIEVRLENLADSATAPWELSSDAHMDASERLTITAAAAGSPADAVMSDCVLDPGADEMAEVSAIPVVAITRLTAHFLASLGLRFGVVTRNEIIGEHYRRAIERYGLGRLFDDVYVLGLSVEDISDDARWNSAIRNAAEAASARGTTILVNGCSAVEVTLTDVAVKVIDPTALALKLVGFAHANGFFAKGAK